MPEELAPFNATGILANVQTSTTDLDFNKTVQTSDYIKPINIIQAMSDILKEPDSPARQGQIWFNMSDKTTRKNLGLSVDVIPLMYRPHACLIVNNQIVKETFKVDDPIYNEIQALNAQKTKGAMPGLDFLVWVPSIKEYAIIFLHKTATRVAPEIKARMKSVITFGATLVEYNGNSWYAPTVNPSTNTNPEMPTDAEELNKVVEMFNNPKINVPVTAEVNGRPR